jgi:excisionase family DNA binding protein
MMWRYAHMRLPDATIPAEPLAYRISDACRVIGIGRTSLYELAADGKLSMIKVAGRTLVPASSLRALIECAERIA